MATGQSGKHIGKDPPNGFKHKETLFLELQYDIRKDGNYVFRYRKMVVSQAKESLAGLNLEDLQWSGPIARAEIHEVLNIDIWADTVVDITAITASSNRPLFWSYHKDREAVMTVDDHSTLYGELLYETVPGTWKKADQIGANVDIVHIKYKAKYKRSNKDRHKFSYNVRLMDQSGKMIDYEIDPDIRNPPVDDP